MSQAQTSRLVLPWAVLAIALLPIAVFAGADWLLDVHGAPNIANVAKLAPAFDGHAEAAGRIQVLAAFILFVAGAAAACVWFVRTLVTLPSEPRRRLLIAYLVVLPVGWLLLAVMQTRETQSYVGSDAVCIALSPVSGQGVWPQPLEAKAAPQDGGMNWVDWLAARFDSMAGRAEYSTGDTLRNRGTVCSAPRFRMLRTLLEIERNLLVFSVAALAFGAIACLTLPPRGSHKRLVRQVVLVQARRLTLILYLSAALLVVGLLFVNAFLRWPAFIYGDAASFNAHVNALLLYFGISYSMLMASYYAPVAFLLARAARRSGEIRSAQALFTDARVGPLKAAKVAAAIFAPALAGLLTSFLDFS